VTSTRFVTTIATALISIFILTATLLAQAPDTDRYWAQWRGPRHSGVSPTANPPLVEVNGRAQVVVPAMERVRSYDLASGELVWESDGLTINTIPSPIFGDGLLFLMGGFAAAISK
jgi:hypothetical protein